ncbi:hypothetical protein PMAYCL1PPCAC_31011, partial [Pristionchus mayeri]
LTCSIDDHLQSNSWNCGDLSPSQLSDDDEFDSFPTSYPSFTESPADSARDTSFEESSGNPSDVADENEFQKPSTVEDSFAFAHQTTTTTPGVTNSFVFNPEYPRNESLSQNDESRLEMEQKREVWELIQRQNMQDYTTVCASLHLPLNIASWSSEQSARWLLHRVEQRQLPPPSSLCISGDTLTKMTLADFDLILPMGGNLIHEDVQLWKAAFDTYSTSHGQPMQSGCLTAADNGMIIKQEWNDINNYCSHQRMGGDQHQQMMYNQQMHGYYQQHQQHHQNAAVQHVMVQQQQMMAAGPPQPLPQPPQFFNNFAVANNVPTDSESDGDEMEDDDAASVLAAPPSYMPDMMQSLPRQPYHRTGGNVHLWIFIRELLECPDHYGGCVRWVDRNAGTFKIENSQHLAQYWGIRKNRSAMNYDKLSRSLRQYYKKGIIQKPEKKQRLVYRFLPPYNL